MIRKRTAQIFDHFNTEATVFDAGVLKSVPHYRQMLSVLIDMLPFPRNKKIDLLDIGTGTGNIAYNLKKAFPHSHLVCLDFSPNMLEVAKAKLTDFKGVEFVLADINYYKFDHKYDAVVSSLTLHHLATDKDKHNFHKKIFSSLKKGGIFINADIVLAADKVVQAINLKKWKDFILESSSAEFVKDRYKKYLAEDRPAILLHELESLRRTGFKAVDVFWKYYNFAIYGGLRS